MSYVAIALIVVAAILYGVNLYFTKLRDINALKKEVEEQALALFLYAEKQQWVSEKKFQFAVDSLKKTIDDMKLAKVIGTSTVEKWVQDLYDSVKSKIEKEVKELQQA